LVPPDVVAGVVDWDKDGLDDLIVGNKDGTLHFFKGSRDGTLVPAVSEQNPFHGVTFHL
jgi:hypothetical protein